MQAAIAWLEEHGDWRKALLICDCKTLFDDVGNPLAADECIRLVQAAVVRLNAALCLEVRWSQAIETLKLMNKQTKKPNLARQSISHPFN